MKVKRICQECKKEFFRIPSRSWASKPGDYGKNPVKYCGSKCAYTALARFWNTDKQRKARSERAKGEGNGRWRGGLLKCVDCGKTLSWRHGLLRCVKCNGKFGSTKFVAEASRNWKGGRTGLAACIRGLEKMKDWRTLVFTRDNWTCQACGLRGGYLEAHHKTKFSALFGCFLALYSELHPVKDQAKLLVLAMRYQPFWDTDNGQTLCRKCHDKTKGNKK